MTRTINIIVGARPQFIKAAVLARRLATSDFPNLKMELIHTGQHYDDNMSDVFFRQLSLPKPAHHLGIGSADAPVQVGQILDRLSAIFANHCPDAVVVVGDTNSTLGAALCAAQTGIPLVHVESGERIYRRAHVPEENNRIVTDHLARLCLASTRHACANLEREGIVGARQQFTGDLHYDLFLWALNQTETKNFNCEQFGVKADEYILATIHRAENTDDVKRLKLLIGAFEKAPLPVVLPLHPRARRSLAESSFQPSGSLRIIDPAGYFDLLGLLNGCRRCVTDSGGVMREAYFSRRPSVIPMHGNYWPDITRAGWSMNVGHDLAALAEAMEHFEPRGEYVEGIFGDGDAAGEILRAIEAMLNGPMDESVWKPGAV